MLDYKYISWDPGGSPDKSTTGVACWNSKGEGQKVAQFNWKELTDFLEELKETAKVEIFIIEEYRIDPRISHKWSKVETIQTIGIIKSFALRNDIKIVEQSRTILPIAQMWSGVKIPSNHKNSHWASAYNHGWYYLQDNKIIKPTMPEIT